MRVERVFMTLNSDWYDVD